MSRPKVRTPALRQQLLEVAIDLLSTGGVASLTTRRVATRANTSAPALYELFGDKSGLIRAVFFEGFQRLLDELQRLPEATGQRQDLADFAGAFRRFTLRHPRLFEVMYTRPFQAFTPKAKERRLGDKTRSFLVDRARRVVETEASTADPVDLAHALLALCIGLATQETAGWLGSSAASRERRWQSAVWALLDGSIVTR